MGMAATAEGAIYVDAMGIAQEVLDSFIAQYAYMMKFHECSYKSKSRSSSSSAISSIAGTVLAA